MEWKSDLMPHFSSLSASLLFIMTYRNVYAKRRSGLAAYKTDGPFFPFSSNLCSDVKTKYYFAFISGCPWGVLLKTDQWPSQVTWGCSPDLCLLNCKLWCITGQSGANDFACIKHLGCPFIKGPFTTGAYIRLQEVVVSKKGQRSKQACEKDLWLIIDW